jgi:hypothetical protein
MELVLMLPKNKPPFIGLVYSDEKLAIKDSEYLLELDPAKSVSLKVSLDEREPRLTVLVDYKEYIYLKITTNEFFAVRHYRTFENADIVKFGPIVMRNGKHCPVWSGKHTKWISTPISIVGFYFRRYL